MKIVVFGDEHRVGALDLDRIVDVNEAYSALGGDRADAQCPADLTGFIEAGDTALAAAADAAGHARAAGPDASGPGGRRLSVPAEGAQLHAPWAGGRLACVGGNYADHLARMQAHGTPVDDTAIKAAHDAARGTAPWGFWKVTHEVAGPGEPIQVPRRADYFDFEGEAAIVIGRRGKDISSGDIAPYVWGVTLVNDWSIRGNMGPARVMSFNLAKNFDGCLSMGPCIVVGELDLDAVDVIVTVNGEERQRFNTRDMIWSFAEVVELLSRDFTLLPGDVLCGGTAQGTAADSSLRGPDGTIPHDLFVKPGDVIEIASPQIGTLVCRAESAGR
jgi:acylpyruvate hydrolase